MKQIITISDNGKVEIPANAAMRDFEIAELFGVRCSAIRAIIKRLSKIRYYGGCAGVGEVQRDGFIIPEYFGLEMIIAIAFQIDSYESEIFCRCILRKVIKSSVVTFYMGSNNGVYV